MARRLAAPGSIQGLAALPPKERGKNGDNAAQQDATRIQQIVELIDHCTLAKDTADRLREPFLSYLLAMTIQESRAALRRTNTA